MRPDMALFRKTSIIAFALLTGTALPATASHLRTLYSFCAEAHCHDGDSPGPLMMDTSGNLFGTAAGGPHKGDGLIFELAGGRKYRRLYTFCPRGGECPAFAPMGPLIADVDGNLYGLALGGAHNFGTAFGLSPNADRSAWTLHILYDFCSLGGGDCTDGAYPVGGLTYVGAATGTPYDGVSPLYGATMGEALTKGGTVFQLTPGESGWSETVLYSFCSQGGLDCIDGASPNGGMFADASGNLFGTTYDGGGNRNNDGTAFELSKNGGTWSETVLYSFCSQAGCSDGRTPAGLIQDASGNLYGTTIEGGRACTNAVLQNDTCGLIFKLVPNGEQSVETVLYQFCAQADCADGAFPQSTLVIDASGDLFGTTFVGGGHDEQSPAGAGVVFRLRGTDLRVLHSFCAQTACTDGWDPAPGVIGAGGTLYGTTVEGGEHGVFDGTIFKLRP